MGQYFSMNLERFDDKSMAYVLSMMANSPPKTSDLSTNMKKKDIADSDIGAEKFLSPELIRD